MNRKQEIAAWFFGLLIALGLLVTDNGIWALVVLGGLAILSLRDRQKKRQRQRTTVQAVPPKASAEPGEVPSAVTLKNVTPHLLAVAMLQVVHDRANMWRTPDIEIPPKADAAVAIACECYELRILLDLLNQRFGSGISKLVEASFASIMDDVDGLSMFSRVNAAIVRAYCLGPAPQGPKDPNLRLDLQVADQILSLFGESDEERQAVRFPLAQSLSCARISSQHFFPGLIANTDFDPLSVAMVTRETEYKGTTNRWKDVPGCFERHLQRKEGNCLFPVSERQPIDEAIHKARDKDDADIDKLQLDMTAALQIMERFGAQETVPSGVLLDFLQKELDPLMRRTAEIGEPARRFFKALEHVRDASFKSLEGQRDDVKSDIALLRDALQGQFNLFLAQIWRTDTPITAAEITPALLCESTDTVAAVSEFLRRHNPEFVQLLYEGSVTLLKDSARQGFELQGADEKLSLLRACAAGTQSTASA